MVGEYKLMLAEGGGTTIQQKGYEMAFHANEALSNGKPLTDTIVKYAERASLADLNVSELKGCIYMLYMGSNTAQPLSGYMTQQQIQAEYFTPAAQEFQASIPPTTIAFHPPHQEELAHQHRQTSGSCGSNKVKRIKNRVHNTYNSQQ